MKKHITLLTSILIASGVATSSLAHAAGGSRPKPPETISNEQMEKLQEQMKQDNEAKTQTENNNTRNFRQKR